MKTITHAFLGILALVVLFVCFIFSVAANFWLPTESALQAKSLIYQGVIIFIVLLFLTTLIGLSLSKTRQEIIITHKKTRALWVLAISCFVLLPIAYFQEGYLTQDRFDLIYFLTEWVGFLCDCSIFVLLLLNIRDGSRLVHLSVINSGVRIME